LDATLSVDPSIQYQTLQGWGTSLAWWANVVGGFPDAARNVGLHIQLNADADPNTTVRVDVYANDDATASDVADIGAETGITSGVSGNQVGTTASPIDPGLGPLDDNGGPTLTHALLAGSPAISAAAPPMQLRPTSAAFPRVVNGRIDIGAFQTQLNHLPTVTAVPGLSGDIGNVAAGSSAGSVTNPLDPLLAPFGDYGGPAQAFALLAGSPALGAGGPSTNLTSAIDASATTLSVDEAAALAVTPGLTIEIDGEQLTITAVDTVTNTLTLLSVSCLLAGRLL
jgi:hypothetical protein